MQKSNLENMENKENKQLKKRGRKPKNNKEENKNNIEIKINSLKNNIDKMNKEYDILQKNKNNLEEEIEDENNEEIEDENNEEIEDENNEEIEDEEEKKIDLEKIPKKRGRKPKIKTEEEVQKIPKKRGRKPKEKVYSVKELSKTFYEENKKETLILHLPINIEDKKNNTPKPNYSEEDNNFNIEKDLNNSNKFNLPTQINFLEENKEKNLFEDSYDSNYNNNNNNNNNIENNDEILEKNDIEETKKAWDVEQKNNNKVQKKNLRNILYEFIDGNKDKVWPQKTNINCWWCCHNFDNVPCSLPCSYKKEKFYVKGVFCNFNCAASYNFSLNDDNVYERYSLLNLMYKKLYYRKFIKINLSPPRESLKIFGGYLSIEEFRENSLNNDKLFNIINPPLISIIPKIEESVNHNKDFNNTLKLNVNENILQKTQDTLKLKRNKPVFNPNNSLQTFMDLKII